MRIMIDDDEDDGDGLVVLRGMVLLLGLMLLRGLVLLRGLMLLGGLVLLGVRYVADDDDLLIF